jgi:uncharacterized protein with HEPN domain
MKNDKLYLIHMSECIQKIETYTAKMDKDDFMTSGLVQDAVLRNLQILSESSQRISTERQLHHPEVNWRQIIGFRNILVHEYLGVDLERVWNVLENDLPGLKRSIYQMLDEN